MGAKIGLATVLVVQANRGVSKSRDQDLVPAEKLALEAVEHNPNSAQASTSAERGSQEYAGCARPYQQSVGRLAERMVSARRGRKDRGHRKVDSGCPKATSPRYEGTASRLANMTACGWTTRGPFWLAKRRFVKVLSGERNRGRPGRARRYELRDRVSAPRCAGRTDRHTASCQLQGDSPANKCRIEVLNGNITNCSEPIAAICAGA